MLYGSWTGKISTLCTCLTYQTGINPVGPSAKSFRLKRYLKLKDARNNAPITSVLFHPSQNPSTSHDAFCGTATSTDERHRGFAHHTQQGLARQLQSFLDLRIERRLPEARRFPGPLPATRQLQTSTTMQSNSADPCWVPCIFLHLHLTPSISTCVRARSGVHCSACVSGLTRGANVLPSFECMSYVRWGECFHHTPSLNITA
jgi:hypothetical protein